MYFTNILIIMAEYIYNNVVYLILKKKIVKVRKVEDKIVPKWGATF